MLVADPAPWEAPVEWLFWSAEEVAAGWFSRYSFSILLLSAWANEKMTMTMINNATTRFLSDQIDLFI
jgi:hypothetical protein